MSRLKQEEVDHIIKLIERITDASTKSDFLTLQEQQLLNQYQKYEWLTGQIKQEERLGMMGRTRWGVIEGFKNELARIQTPYDADKARMLKNKLSRAQKKHIQSIVPPLQEELDLYLTPRWPEILKLSAKGQFDREFKRELESYFIKDKTWPTTNNVLITISEKMIRELKRIKAKLEYEQEQIVHIAKMARQDLTTEKPAETEPGTGVPEQEQEKAKTITSVNIQSFKGVLGDVQADNLQIGDYASIQEQPQVEKKSKASGKVRRLFKRIIGWLLKKTWYLIGAIIFAIIVAILIDIFGDFGWLDQIKVLIYKIFTGN